MLLAYCSIFDCILKLAVSLSALFDGVAIHADSRRGYQEQCGDERWLFAVQTKSTSTRLRPKGPRQMVWEEAHKIPETSSIYAQKNFISNTFNPDRLLADIHCLCHARLYVHLRVWGQELSFRKTFRELLRELGDLSSVFTMLRCSCVWMLTQSASQHRRREPSLIWQFQHIR
jgi:hypothetical protein